MEELAIKIAELLDITVESAIKLYPVLRSQFIVYKTTNVFQIITINIIVIIFIYISLSTLINYSRNDSKIHDYEMELIGFNSKEKDTKLNRKIDNLKNNNVEYMKNQFKKSAYLLIPLSIFIISKIIQYVFATDLIMMKEFL